MQSGTLTFRSSDGYILEAPVEYLSVAVGDDYSASVGINDHLLDSIYLTPQNVTFTATLKYGESYTVRDLGVEVEKTFAIKGNMESMGNKWRSAMGVPADAKARYLSKNDVTKFTWTERVVVDGEG